MQVKLLRVLQDLEFEPVGGTKTERIDTRVILATNENLDKLVAEGKFRLDLYYRINVINIELPPLRDRIADIPLLANRFLEEVCAESGKTVHGFTDEAVAALQRYSWPGNVRELQNFVERAVLLGKGDVIRPEDLPPALSAIPRITNVEPVGVRSLKQALEGPERQILLEVLEANHWNRQTTADVLGVNRTTLYKKMKRLGLEDMPQAAR
jgi:DNA-binding NtrC family response regulator